MKFNVSKLKFYLIIILVCLLTLYYHPFVIDLPNIQITFLAPSINVVFGLLFIISFDLKNIQKSKVIIKLLTLILLIVLILSFANMLFDFNYIGEIRALIIPIFAIIIGWQYKINENKLLIIIYLLIILTLYISLSHVFINVGGFIIDQYKVFHKNTIGVIVSTSIILSLILLLNTNTNKILKIFLLLSIVFLLISLLTFRARTATLVSILFLIFILYKKFSTRNVFFGGLGLIIFIIFLVLIIPDNAKNFVVDSFLQNTGDDITSGRSDINKEAIYFLKDNLLIGNLKNTAKNIEWVHNYPLLKIFEFGLFFSFPILLMYLYLLFTLIKENLKKDIFNIYNAGFVILLIPFAISMAEPTFPYGPGTATIFNFILFGISLRYNYQISKINTISPKQY